MHGFCSLEENNGLKEENDNLLISMRKKDNDLAEMNTTIAKLIKELQQLKR